MLQQLGKNADAVAAYEQAVRLEPDNAYYWESLALNYAIVGQADNALRAAEETLRRNPESTLAYLIRGGVQADRGNKDAARADYQRVLALPNAAAGLKQLAQQGLDQLK